MLPSIKIQPEVKYKCTSRFLLVPTFKRAGKRVMSATDWGRFVCANYFIKDKNQLCQFIILNSQSELHLADLYKAS